MDDIIYAKYINKYVGYGCFSKTLIQKDTVLGEYTGVIAI